MTTKAHATTRYIASNWESYYPSAVLSGIVGDPAHQARGGYHISIEDQSSTNYSVIRPDDKAPPGKWPRDLAAAIDMSMNTRDMTLCSDRLWWVWNDVTDPRRIYLNAFNGWFGSGDAKRYDFVTKGISITTPDHKWHVHGEIRRKYVEDMVAADAILSALRGETKEQYLAIVAGIGDDDMFCKYSDVGEKVRAMQLQLLQFDPACLPVAGPDSDYGDETASALSRIVTGGDGRIYGADAWARLQQLCQIKNGSGSTTIDWPLKAVINFPNTTVTLPATQIQVDVLEQE